MPIQGQQELFGLSNNKTRCKDMSGVEIGMDKGMSRLKNILSEYEDLFR